MPPFLAMDVVSTYPPKIKNQNGTEVGPMWSPFEADQWEVLKLCSVLLMMKPLYEMKKFL